jgi:hypothetical protein
MPEGKPAVDPKYPLKLQFIHAVAQVVAVLPPAHAGTNCAEIE